MESISLEKISLTRGESKVYLSLLKTGHTSAGPLVKEASISRSKIYEILERLITKGLVSYTIQNGVKRFNSIDPRLIPDYLEKEKDKIEKQKQDFIRLLPLLTSQIHKKEAEQVTEVFEGWAGVKNVFNSLIKDANRGDVWYAFGIPSTMSKQRGMFFSRWRRETDKIGILQKLIANKKIKGSQELAEKSHLSQIRYIKQETPTSVDIFKDYTLLGVWTEKPIIISIKSKEVSNSFRKYFENLWSIAKQ